MKRLVCPEHGVIALTAYEVPVQLKLRQMIVRNTHGAEKHGTMESFVYKHGNQRGPWDREKGMHLPGEGAGWKYPIPLGNMQVGIVERVGPDCGDIEAGDRVVYFGGFAPIGVVDLEWSAAWKINSDTSWKAATCLDPASYAYCAIRDSQARIGDAIAIFSLGAIGLTAVILAKMAGCHPVVAIDPVDKRRRIAEKLGADLTLSPVGIDTGAKLRELTGWRGMDVVIEYSGSVPALNAALRGVARGGTIACGAFPSPYPNGLDFGGEAHINRPNIVFTRTESEPNRDHPRWDIQRIRYECMRLIIEGKINGDVIVDPVVPFSDKLADDYERIMRDKDNSVKMGVTYD